MKKLLLFFSLFLLMTSFNSQEKRITKTGTITFEASVPSFEEVAAKNESVTCVLNLNTGEIASLALIKGFRFKLALMEEHFNENYIDSDRYPKSTFRGKIENFNVNKLSSDPKDFTIKGKLELHGKTKDISIIAQIKKINSEIEINSDFQLNSEDFDIKIPSVVKNKVSNKVNVRIEFVLK